MPGIDLIVNGREEHLDVLPGTSLLLALRNDLQLKGARPGCSIGVCGSCAVLVNGEVARSCSTPVEAVVGAEITTPEGLGSSDALHPVQEAFLQRQAAQCGYCINGIIMGAVAAENRGDVADPGEVPGWLDEHVCRCGTHVRIIQAIADRHTEEMGASHARSDSDRLGSERQMAAQRPSAPDPSAAVGRVEAWMSIAPDGRFVVHTGKVELGQGLRTALAQIAAAQLGVPMEVVDVMSSQTGRSPNEMYTAGSMSVEESGTAIARAAVAFRRLVLERASGMLGDAVDQLDLDRDRVVSSTGASVGLDELAAEGDVTGDVTSTDVPNWSTEPIGQSIHRDDLVGKLTGRPSYVHDLELPGMLHARAVLPPSLEAELLDIATAEVEAMPGVVEVVHDGRLIMVIAEREDVTVRAVAKLENSIRWRIPDSGVTPSNLLETMQSADNVDREVASEPLAGSTSGATLVQAGYSQPYQAHASIAPSCAVAAVSDAQLCIWTHSQGIYPLRDSLAAMLDVEPGDLRVLHLDGPGCYGHNLADDAAAFGAIAARAVPGRPVRFQFSSEDEFSWEPYGSAMFVDLAAALDSSGRISRWSHRVMSDTHNTRPDGSADRLMISWLTRGGSPFRWPGAGFGAGGTRNAVPLYDLPSVEAFADHAQGPLRVSALRTLGAYTNVFAAESFMDELAERSGSDPLAFRLAHLADTRASALLERVATMADWEPHVGPSGRGVGLAVSRYKNLKAYVAAAVHVEVDADTAVVHVRHVDMACDAGIVINPDGVRNQLEGGLIQGLSRALYEAVPFDGTGTLARDWHGYPIFPFSATPSVRIELVQSEEPAVGVGEASPGPSAAALANAIDDAIGVRLRHLPFTPERIREHLFEMQEDEAARVLLS